MKPQNKPKLFLLDVDGVMTTGQFIYTENGKTMKVFGPDDHDGLSLLKKFIDMKFPLDLVSTIRRVEWISENYDLQDVIYMGDGIFDHYVFEKVGYSIAPANADKNARESANYVTERLGGDRAVAEACLHILEKFFEPYDPKKLPSSGDSLSGQWSV